MRRTGFPPMVRSMIYDRSGGRCERCGEHTSDMEIHHRRPRGMGGTKRPETNQTSCGVLLCGSDHRIVESHRTQAYDDGFLVHQGHDPKHVPIKRRGVWCYLDDQGGISFDVPEASTSGNSAC